jgi:hypothetical protein
MEHIFKDERGVVHFDSYFMYLESVKERLPPHVYVFASDFKHYSLRDHASLHDAWLDHLHIVELAEGERSELRKIEIEACFLGPFHDRRIFLSYKNVTGYSLQTSPHFAALPLHHVGHGDLLIHELRFHPSGNMIHEMEFSRGSTLLIRCSDLTHREELFSP